MATIKVRLNNGLRVGEKMHIDAEIREASVGDMLDAAEESERLVNTPDGYQLLASPTMVGINILRRQIVAIGGHPGPLTLGEIKKLDPSDLNLLQAEAQKLETASLKESVDRGRDTKAPA